MGKIGKKFLMKQIDEKTKQEIRLYFHIHPKAKLDEVAKLFEKKIGRVVNRTTIREIKKSKSPLEEQAIVKAGKIWTDKMAKNLASVMENNSTLTNKIIAKGLILLNHKLGNDPLTATEISNIITAMVRNKSLTEGTWSFETTIKPEDLNKFKKLHDLTTKAKELKITRKIGGDAIGGIREAGGGTEKDN